MRFEKSPYEGFSRQHSGEQKTKVKETYGDGNEKDSGTWEETIHVKTLPDRVPSPLVISIQCKLGLSLRQNAQRSTNEDYARYLGVKPELLRELQVYLGVGSLYAIVK